MKVCKMKNTLLTVLLMINQLIFAQDSFKTDHGKFDIHFVGHGSLYIVYNGQTIHIDPFSKLADYSKLPDADYILVTHQHGDHLDPNAIDQIVKKNTKIISAAVCKEGLQAFSNVSFISNGEVTNTKWGKLEAIPAYNIIHMRSEGQVYHPKGEGNGYILNIDGKRIYIAGDTENIPEMRMLNDIDIAFLPMNLPYTMTPEMTADAALIFKPQILYPYHFGDTDTQRILDLLSKSGIDVRIRDMK